MKRNFRNSRMIFTCPIEVTAADLAIIAPDRAVAGSTIEVGWSGPDASSDNIQIGKPGGPRDFYTYVRQGNPLRLQIPTFTNEIYNPDDEPLPILTIEREDPHCHLTLADDYRITLSNVTEASMAWFSEASGDGFQCVRVWW